MFDKLKKVRTEKYDVAAKEERNNQVNKELLRDLFTKDKVKLNRRTM